MPDYEKLAELAKQYRIAFIKMPLLYQKVATIQMLLTATFLNGMRLNYPKGVI